MLALVSSSGIGMEDDKGTSTPHTIVLRGCEVQADKIGQEEVVLGEIPRAVSNNQCVGVVGRRAWGGKVVQRRHDGGSPTGARPVGEFSSASSRVLVARRGGNASGQEGRTESKKC